MSNEEDNAVVGKEIFQEEMNTMKYYKIGYCNDASCPYKKSEDSNQLIQNKTKKPNPNGNMNGTNKQSPHDCFYYHNDLDRRRSPFSSLGLAYSKFVSDKALMNPTLSANNNDIDCLNGYEYLYHPLNYKTNQCPYIKNDNKNMMLIQQRCQYKYCPYYHTKEEYEYFCTYKTNLGQNINGIYNIESCRLNSNVKSIHIALNNDSNSNDDNKFYIMNQRVDFIEDHFHEFKDQKLHLYTITRYINGFLNSKGGSLYYGIDDDGVIKGVDLRQYEIESFKQKIYDELAKFKPKVDNRLVKVNLVPIYSKKPSLSIDLQPQATLSLDKGENDMIINNTNKVNWMINNRVNNMDSSSSTTTTNLKLLSSSDYEKIPNMYIVEIQVVKGDDFEIYFTGYGEIHVRRSASINQLKTSDIRELIKYKLKQKEGYLLESLEKKLSYSKGENISNLDIKAILDLEKNLRNTLVLIDDRLKNDNNGDGDGAIINGNNIINTTQR